MESDRFLIKVAELYFKDGLSQEKIAKKLNVSRTTISRALGKAKQEGIVRIHITYPESSNMLMEKEIEKRFGLEEALVAVPSGGQTSAQAVAGQSVDYVIRVLKKNMILGVTWGRAMYEFVRYLKVDERPRALSYRNVKIVPFLGTPSEVDRNYKYRMTYSNTLATGIGDILGCTSYNLSAPMFVKDEESKNMIESIEGVSKVLKIAEQSDIALFGIGTLETDSSIIKAGMRSKEEYEELRRQGGVGEIVGRIYDSFGNTLDEKLNKKTVGISLERMKKIPIRAGVAYGPEKTEAITGALKGGIINVLITDAATAENILGI
ncbi:sugar-binding transcriptional regulator [Anaerostipes sp.]|uniref:sugar-binding transcriptional regulator n=1 Tax=Anaerostipes sp. TaxID=1872530 RepID=UPI0025C637E2|nr:sugar-binding transcriptional regulator [Anaerostipes sp.]MBS7009187.1 sugar-binding transcriptional regulator [Anaerostipes sp.]